MIRERVRSFVIKTFGDLEEEMRGEEGQGERTRSKGENKVKQDCEE